MSPSRVNVRTLLCHRDVDLALHCLGSLATCCVDPIALAIHEDGSLTADDRARIAAELPGARIVDRRAADEVMRERLARHAAAWAFRAGSVWGLKLLDVALLEAGDCYYVDGDVRFFRRFRGLFCREALAGGAVFLRDTVWAAYSVRPWHLLDRRGLRRALLLHGRDHSTSVGGPISRAIAVYASDPVPIERARLAVVEGAVVVLHSSRAADRFAALVDHFGLARGEIRLAALSDGVAASAGTGWAAVTIAHQPTDDALLAAAARLTD